MCLKCWTQTQKEILTVIGVHLVINLINVLLQGTFVHYLSVLQSMILCASTFLAMFIMNHPPEQNSSVPPTHTYAANSCIQSLFLPLKKHKHIKICTFNTTDRCQGPPMNFVDNLLLCVGRQVAYSLFQCFMQAHFVHTFVFFLLVFSSVC